MLFSQVKVIGLNNLRLKFHSESRPIHNWLRYKVFFERYLSRMISALAFYFSKFVSAVNSTTFNRFACPFHRRKVLFKTIYNWKPIWNVWITSWVIRYSLGAIEPRTGALAFHFYKFVSVVNYTIFHRVTCPIHRWKTLFLTILKNKQNQMSSIWNRVRSS